MRTISLIIFLILATAAHADLASKTYLAYQNDSLSANQRLRLMCSPKLGQISTNIHYELSARTNENGSGDFDRLNLKWNNLTIGRDAVALGVGRIWSPNDLFKPFSPTEIDKDYKTGVDLIRYDQSISSLSHLSLIYATLDRSYIGRLRSTIGNFGTSFIAGKVKNSATWGFTFDGSIGGAGLRSSLNITTSPQGNTSQKYIIGSDYMFPNDLYIVGEFYNDQGKNYLALGYSLDFKSLWKISGYIISNFNDGSRLYWEEINYSISDESSIKSGVIISGGSRNSEYSYFKTLVYMLLSIYL